MRLSYGFVVNESNSCAYSKSDEHDIVIVYLYIDNMFIIGTSIEVIKLTKGFLNSKFEMKDYDEADLIFLSRREKLQIWILS